MFIDEVQNVPEFEKTLEGLYIHLSIDLYITCLDGFHSQTGTSVLPNNESRKSQTSTSENEL